MYKFGFFFQAILNTASSWIWKNIPTLGSGGSQWGPVELICLSFCLSVLSSASLFGDHKSMARNCVQHMRSQATDSNPLSGSIICLSFRPYVHLSICPSVHLSIRPSVYQSIRPSIHPYIHTSVHLSVRPSVHLSIRPFVHLYIYTSVCLSVCPSICLVVRRNFANFVFVLISSVGV